jgi:O-antigen ligase
MKNLNFYIEKPNLTLDNFAKVMFVLGIFFTPLGTAPTNIFLALTAFIWLISGGYKERFKDQWINIFAWATLALLLFIYIAGIYSSAESNEVIFQYKKYAKLFFIFIGISLFKDRKWREIGLNLFSVSMLITLLLSVGSVFLSIPIVKGGGGNYFVFKDHIVQNLMMSFFVLLMLIKSRYEFKSYLKIAYLSVAIVAVVDIIFLVQGRTGYISLMVVLIIFSLFFIPLKKWWLCLVSAILFLLASFYLSDNFSDRLKLTVAEYKNQDSNELTSVGQRLEFFKKSVVLIKERPLFGWGTGAYGKEFCRVAISPEWCEAGKAHPHNQFLAFGVQLGLFGLFLYILFLSSAVQLARKLDKPENVMLTGLVGILVVDSVFHAPLFLVAEAQFFILMLGLLAAGNYTNRSHEK